MSPKPVHGPNELPVVQEVRYLREPTDYIMECQRRFGEVFSLQLVEHGMVFVCSPELTKEVYTDNDALAALLPHHDAGAVELS